MIFWASSLGTPIWIFWKTIQQKLLDYAWKSIFTMLQYNKYRSVTNCILDSFNIPVDHKCTYLQWLLMLNEIYQNQIRAFKCLSVKCLHQFFSTNLFYKKWTKSGLIKLLAKCFIKMRRFNSRNLTWLSALWRNSRLNRFKVQSKHLIEIFERTDEWEQRHLNCSTTSWFDVQNSNGQIIMAV